MAHLLTLAALVAFLLSEAASIDFINPPPFGREGDFSTNPIYPEGSTVTVVWTKDRMDKPVSLTLVQLNGTEFMLPMEYIFQSVVNKSDFTWLVATTKNLTLSNMFYLSIFEEGSRTSDSNSHYFNISKRSSQDPSAQSSSTIRPTNMLLLPTGTSTSPLSMQISSPTQQALSTQSIASASSPSLHSSAPSNDGTPTAAKIGMGVGIPLALVVGVGAGFLLFSRQRRRRNGRTAQTEELPTAIYSPAVHDGNKHNAEAEGLPRSPKEMATPGPQAGETWFELPAGRNAGR